MENAQSHSEATSRKHALQSAQQIKAHKEILYRRKQHHHCIVSYNQNYQKTVKVNSGGLN